MLNIADKVQVSDTTMLNSSTTARYKIPFTGLSTKRQNYGLRRRFQNIPVMLVFR